MILLLAHNGTLYRYKTNKAQKVIVEERINGTMVITHNDTF